MPPDERRCGVSLTAFCRISSNVGEKSRRSARPTLSAPAATWSARPGALRVTRSPRCRERRLTFIRRARSGCVIGRSGFVCGLPSRYHVARLIPSASQGCDAFCLIGPPKWRHGETFVKGPVVAQGGPLSRLAPCPGVGIISGSQAAGDGLETSAN